MQAQSTVSTPNKSVIPPPAFEGPPVPETANAMDKVVGRFDVCQSTALFLQDAMNKIVCLELNQPSLNVETDEILSNLM